MSNADDMCACGLPRARHVDDGPVWSNPGLLRCQGYRPAPQPAPSGDDDVKHWVLSALSGLMDRARAVVAEYPGADDLWDDIRDVRREVDAGLHVQNAPSGDEAKVRETIVEKWYAFTAKGDKTSHGAITGAVREAYAAAREACEKVVSEEKRRADEFIKTASTERRVKEIVWSATGASNSAARILDAIARRGSEGT